MRSSDYFGNPQDSRPSEPTSPRMGKSFVTGRSNPRNSSRLEDAIRELASAIIEEAVAGMLATTAPQASTSAASGTQISCSLEDLTRLILTRQDGASQGAGKRRYTMTAAAKEARSKSARNGDGRFSSRSKK